MLRVIGHFKLSQQHFFEDMTEGVDWGDEDDNDQLPPEEMWDQFLVDNIEDQDEDEFSQDEYRYEPEYEPKYDSIEFPEEEVPILEEDESGAATLPDGELIQPEEEFASVDELLKTSMREPPR